MDSKKRALAVRVSLDMSPEANDLLDSLASAHGTTKSQILRRAVALYHVASEAKASGNRIAVIDQEKKWSARSSGFDRPLCGLPAHYRRSPLILN